VRTVEEGRERARAVDLVKAAVVLAGRGVVDVVVVSVEEGAWAVDGEGVAGAGEEGMDGGAGGGDAEREGGKEADRVVGQAGNE
jgi:hypothetical protein